MTDRNPWISPPLRTAIVIVGYAVVYVFLAQLCFATAGFRGGLPSVWPPAGLSAALILIGGIRYWPGIALGTALVGYTMAVPDLLILLNSTAQLIEAFLFWGILRRSRRFDPALRRASDIVVLIVYAAIPSTLVGGFLGNFSWWVAGEGDAHNILRGSLMWWLRNLGGIVLVTPLLLIWRRRPLWSWQSWTAVLLPTVLLIVIGIIVGELEFSPETQGLFGLLALTLPLPLILWVGSRYGMHGITAIHVAMFVVITEAGYQLNLAYGRTLMMPHVEVAVIEVVVAIIVLGTSLLLAAAISERRDLEVRARRSQRLDSLGRLAGGVAHDFNNMLAVIAANVEIARTQLIKSPEKSPLHLSLDQVQDAVDRAHGLTRQLLHFGRRTGGTIETIDLGRLVTDLQKLLRHLVGDSIRLSVRCDEPIPKIRAVPSQIEQVVMNLILNARDAIDEEGTIEIQISGKGRTVASPSAAEAPETVELTVRDNGIGIDRDQLERIFDPFYTSKEIGKGTGLGLATAYGIVTSIGGTITVESEVGQGSIFRIEMPAAEPAPTRSRLPSTRSLPGEGPEVVEARKSDGTTDATILLCEDDDSVRGAVEGVLSGAGYRVLSADHPKRVIHALEADELLADLLLTDVVMPGLDGLELAERVKKVHPRMPVIYMSGKRSPGTDQESPWLAKPFTAETLLLSVKNALRTDPEA